MSRFIRQATIFIRDLSVRLQCRTITITSALYAEPPRKKRRIDPAVFRLRVERKIKKLEREIGKMEREPRQLIPILEYQLSNSELRDLKARPGRSMKEFDIDEGRLKAAQRLWNFYRLEQSKMEQNSVRKVERAQTRAIKSLEQIDDELYRKTVAVDEITLIPYISNFIRKETAPNANYIPPDGYIKNVTKQWVM